MHNDTKYNIYFQRYDPNVCINKLYTYNGVDYQLAQFQTVI